MKTITVKVHLLVDYTPGNEEHLKQVTQNYFRGKGVQVVEPKEEDKQPIWVEV